MNGIQKALKAADDERITRAVTDASRPRHVAVQTSLTTDLTSGDIQMLERLRTMNVFGDFLQHFGAVNPEAIDVPTEWVSWGDELQKAFPSLGMFLS